MTVRITGKTKSWRVIRVKVTKNELSAWRTNYSGRKQNSANRETRVSLFGKRLRKLRRCVLSLYKFHICSTRRTKLIELSLKNFIFLQFKSFSTSNGQRTKYTSISYCAARWAKMSVLLRFRVCRAVGADELSKFEIYNKNWRNCKLKYRNTTNARKDLPVG